MGLAATWGLLGYLVLSTGLIARQPELGAPDAWSYARSQPGVILYYLRLAAWPSPCASTTPGPWPTGSGRFFPGVLVVGVLLAATAWGLLGRASLWISGGVVLPDSGAHFQHLAAGPDGL